MAGLTPKGVGPADLFSAHLLPAPTPTSCRQEKRMRCDSAQ
ncbi:hypothetical protein GFS60_03192 [Rhodococcus sp. WAY2]|nr:hypothetical protein GFS60_03192 [Rhodococcus sp. WAY2]